jgi:hypothetical protein
MPRFHFGTPVQSPNLTPEAIANLESTRIRSETTNLANFFAARDGAVFPYQDIPQREQAYLAERETLFGDTAGTTPVLASKYLGTGYTLITKNQCVQCHAFGQFRPTGEENTHGPNLRMAASRLRPEFLLQWIANPTRANPYTAMPQVFPPPSAQASTPAIGVPPELEDKPFEQILAVRDTLLNYVTAVEQELATVAPPPPAATVPAASAPAPAGAPGSGQ